MYTLTALLVDDSGATMVEYGMIIALVAMLSLTAIGSIGHTVNSFFHDAARALIVRTHHHA